MVWAIDGYEPLAQVGSGSTGVVVSARDLTTGTNVAIKYLARNLYESRGFMVRYRGEVAVLGLVEHPQVANVYELIEHGGAGAVVTELVDGVSLRHVLQQTGPLEPQAALYVMKGALLGLCEVHGNGIVHRALKPENVLIDAGGNIKIVDVGMTPSTSDRMPPNHSYAAPELWTGGEPTSTSDVYAATAVLFECLGGQPPLGTGGAWLGASSQPPDAAISAIPVDAAGRQARAFMALGLAVDPRNRPADARAALQQMDIVAFSAFGSAWYDGGQALLLRRLARISPPAQSYRRLTQAMPAFATNAAALAPAAASNPAGVMAPRPSSPIADALSAGHPFTVDADATSMRTASAPTAQPVAERAEWKAPEEWSHRAPTNPRNKILVLAAVLVLLVAGTALALASAFGRGEPAPTAVTTNSHQPIVVPGPTVPTPTASGPGADTTKPARPVGLRVIGRSISAVSINWTASIDDVEVAGYIVLRDGNQVGTTYGPGYTDRGLQTLTKYQYAVAAFDAAGNISAASAPVSATTLKEPDVSPPSVPTNLHSTGASTTTIVLAWSASQDGIGVAGYEVYRNGALLANVPLPGYTDTGLSPATSYTYRVRAFDTSNNASADSPALTATTLTAPDTMPPTVPANVQAIAGGPDSITVSWTASSDNIGVVGYRVYRNGGSLVDVTGTSFLDEGLTPETLYSYQVSAIDAATNESARSSPATQASTLALPTPSPSPTVDPPSPSPTTPAPVIESVTLTATMLACTVTVEAEVVASAPMDVILDFTINGVPGVPVPLTFTDDLTQNQTLASNIDATVNGDAWASADGQSDIANWVACESPSP